MRVGALVSSVVLVLLAVNSSLGQEDVKVPEEVLKHFKDLVGSWEVEGRVGSTKTEGGWSARWGKGRNCLIRESWYTLDGQTMTGTGVMGWDSGEERIAEYTFWTPNDSVTIMWKLLPSGNLEGEFIGTEDGMAVTASAKVTKNGPNEFVYESKNAAGDEIEAVFRKVPRKKQNKPKE